MKLFCIERHDIPRSSELEQIVRLFGRAELRPPYGSLLATAFVAARHLTAR